MKEGLPPLRLVLHDGETNNYLNTNIVSAVALGADRIGHGFDLVTHPSLVPIVKEEGTAMEVCPLSNLFLKLNLDIRSHPARWMIKSGVPITINPDDPAIFGCEGVTFDFVAAYSAWRLDFKSMYRLGHNSLKYSLLGDASKERAIAHFDTMFAEYIQQMASLSIDDGLKAAVDGIVCKTIAMEWTMSPTRSSTPQGSIRSAVGHGSHMKFSTPQSWRYKSDSRDECRDIRTDPPKTTDAEDGTK